MAGSGENDDSGTLHGSNRQVVACLDKKCFGEAKKEDNLSGSSHGCVINEKFGVTIHVKLVHWESNVDEIMTMMSGVVDEHITTNSIENQIGKNYGFKQAYVDLRKLAKPRKNAKDDESHG